MAQARSQALCWGGGGGGVQSKAQWTPADSRVIRELYSWIIHLADYTCNKHL